MLYQDTLKYVGMLHICLIWEINLVIHYFILHKVSFSLIVIMEVCDIPMDKLGDLDGEFLQKEGCPLTWHIGLIELFVDVTINQL